MERAMHTGAFGIQDPCIDPSENSPTGSLHTLADPLALRTGPPLARLANSTENVRFVCPGAIHRKSSNKSEFVNRVWKSDTPGNSVIPIGIFGAGAGQSVAVGQGLAVFAPAKGGTGGCGGYLRGVGAAERA